MKSLPVIVLLVVLAVPACFPCKRGEGCIPRGGFCHPGNWRDCCCPDSCLGVFIGACFGVNRRVNGLMTYTIKDASNNPLLEETVPLDDKTAVSKEQLDRVVARFGNQELYVDAHIDYYDASTLKQAHQSVRGYKIN